MEPQRYGPFPYRTARDLLHFRWPGEARLALWVIPNIEFFPLDEPVPGGRGVPIDTLAKLPGGDELNGMDGLRSYLLEQRRDDFLRQFCRKLLGYALGRGVQLSDKPLLDDMLVHLKSRDYRVVTAIELIVLSPQFREIRGRD